MSSFSCPFCNCSVSIDFTTEEYFYIPDPHSQIGVRYKDGSGKIFVYLCSNCGHIHLKAEKQGKLDSFNTLVYPQSIYKHYPDYIPEQIRADYEEACKIRDLSPKAAATLCRRCLQGMIRDFWKIAPDTLYNEISSLQGQIRADQWKAIDALRQLGNIGAHMEKDVSLIVDIDPGEADMLIQLIEHLIDDWYIARHAEQELYRLVVQTNSDKQADRRHPH